ncbi:MAG: OmpA family protein, partial [Muribaculaceae bacterium]|nr:OmpA family protein [Muribaculaceae bacterium]
PELSVEDNLAGPEVPVKLVARVTECQQRVAHELKKKGLHVELMRDRQVIVVTLPATPMFQPNDSVLRDQAQAWLRPLAGLLKHPDFYKTLVAVHSDDTGSEEYVNTLTAGRADAIYRWLVGMGCHGESIVPYGIGADEPLAPNDSRARRVANRRVEIYLVPGPGMIEMARTGRLQ